MGRRQEAGGPVGRQAEIPADPGHHLTERTVAKLVVLGVGQALIGLRRQLLDLVLDGVFVRPVPAGFAPRGDRGPGGLVDQAAQAYPALGLPRPPGQVVGPVEGGEVLGEPRLQGDGHPHCAGDPGEDEAGGAGLLRARRGLGLAPAGLGDLHPDLRQPRQHGHLPIDQRPRRCVGRGGSRGDVGGIDVDHAPRIKSWFEG